MIYALIGHRGVGKTSLLLRIKKYNPKASTYCLDQEIEKCHGSIQKIFETKSEDYFRKLEEAVFLTLFENIRNDPNDVYIALGAGYCGPIPEHVQIIWIQRNIDASKFLFLNRPNLNSNKLNPQFPEEHFHRREHRYSNIADEICILREGVYSHLPSEEVFFKNQIENCGGALTLLPEHFRRDKLIDGLKKKDNWGLQYFELRSDLLSEGQIQKIIDLNLKTPLLYSFRQSVIPLSVQIELAGKCSAIDWDVSLGTFPNRTSQQFYLSAHTKEDTFLADLQKWENSPDLRVKWSPEISHMSQLILGHRWMLENPQLRAFLPRSQDGRWKWYRLLIKNKMSINFWREDRGSSADQPTLLEWLSTQDEFSSQAAVLGLPVEHSWSPTFHESFFLKKLSNFFAIPISEHELDSGGFSFLQELGFCAFAVTSPLKAWAAHLTQQSVAVNTLVLSKSENKWLGFSCDMLGFEKQIIMINDEFLKSTVAIWGSGAMAEEIRGKYSHVKIFSARTGTESPKGSSLPETINILWAPQILVWASGGLGLELLLEKYPHWNPDLIVDLNYRCDSPAISFAHRKGARYISGEGMFFGQGLEQQKIWSRELSIN